MIALAFLNIALASSIPTVESIRSRINDDARGWSIEIELLLSYGPLAHPAYLDILKDKKSTGSEVFNVLCILSSTKQDIRPFRPQLVQLLSYEHGEIPALAASLYVRHVTTADIPTLCMLLFDPDKYVKYSAAETLSKLGDRNTLAAFEMWRESKANTAPENVRAIVKTFEDELRTRLEIEVKAKKSDNPK